MSKWEKWQQKAVSDEQNGTGEYSDAGARSRRYQAAGLALCESAVLVDNQIYRLAFKLDRDTGTIAQPLTDEKCDPRRGTAPGSADRQAALNAWAGDAHKASDLEAHVVDACFTKLGGERQPPDLPAMLLPTE
jgi:hypothetical protein